MATGKINWFNSKGYGFISIEGEDDIFIHHSEIQKEEQKSIIKGTEVTFDIVKCEKGLKAVNCKVK